MLLLACVSPQKPDLDTDPGGETDASQPGDTPDSGLDTSSDSGPDTSSDSGLDTSSDSGGETAAPPLPGEVLVEGSHEGAAFGFSCSAEDPPERFPRSWGYAVGNLVASFACLDETGLLVSFTDPVEGTWAAPDGTADYYVDTPSGGGLGWYVGTASAWELELTEVTVVSLDVLEIEGRLSGSWTEGEVSATFSLQLPCPSC